MNKKLLKEIKQFLDEWENEFGWPCIFETWEEEADVKYYYDRLKPIG